MSEIRTLLFLELRSLYGINKALHTKDKKTKNRYFALSIVWALLICMVIFYVGGLVYGLCTLGLSDIVPAYLAVLLSVFILIFGMFTAGSRIFGQKGYDILAAMPLKSRSIVLSRFLAMYISDLAFAFLIILPGIATYGLCMKPGIAAIPLVISTLFGTLILAISSRMKRKSLVQTLLMLIFVVGTILLSFGMDGAVSDFTLTQLSELAQIIGSIFEKIYLPAMWFNKAVIDYDIISLVLFIVVSLTVMIFTVFITAENFHTIVRRLQNFTAKHDYKIGEMASRGLLKALYFREAKRYFSSSIYVVNTIIGPVMGAVMSIALCIAGLDTITSSLPIEVDVLSLLPFVFAAVFCMMTTTSTSISMEGKQFWIVKSMPVPAKTLFDSKILLNLSLMLPFYVISVAAIAIAVKPNPQQFVWLVIIPASLMVFVVVFRITINLKFHSFDWEKEEAVVKQSLPSMLGGFLGMLLGVLFAGIVFVIPAQYENVIKIVICLLLWGGAILMYQSNNKKSLEWL